jgi:AraC family transcriptional regulator, regulatory protein of adaptative response / methylated-DNA-[protein]-cysteine methyltransferase
MQTSSRSNAVSATSRSAPRVNTPCVTSTIDTPLGPMVAAARDEGVCLLEYTTPGRLDAQLAGMQRRFRCDLVSGAHPHLDHLAAELTGYFAGTLTAFSTPLLIAGTPFQTRVWAALLRIPYGQTRSYEDLSREIGSDGAQRAVGHANGSNHIAIVIPCHRVINKSGKLGGYGGELWRKQALLALESRRAAQPALF